MIEILFLILGIYGLIKGSKGVVEQLPSISKTLSIPVYLTTFLIFPIITSLPEFAMMVFSLLNKVEKVSFGNLIGASIMDIGIIFSLGTIVYGFKVSKKLLKKSLVILSLINIVLIYGLLFGFDSTFGYLGLMVFFIFSKELFETDRIRKKKIIQKKEIKSIELFLVYSLLLIISAEIVSLSLKLLIEKYLLSAVILGGTLVSISTTLPELSVFMQALKMRRYEIALGDILGSCFVNILFILSLASIFHKFFLNAESVLMVVFYIVYSSCFLGILYKRNIERFVALIFLLVYVLFIIILI